ncbi:MAG: AAA family ATPase, partial [Parvularculaceae bacterium]|nr:AAA family ATPase [Parvularculaceae bacterium]
MLTALHIKDFVLIDQLSLPLGEGLTALTGETGAGKSILLEALGLAAGGRAGRGAVRQGAERGIVTASFEPGADHPVWRLLEENGVGAADDQVILRRIQGADGKSRAFVNDQPASIGLLKAVGELLIEIHGQHDG